MAVRYLSRDTSWLYAEASGSEQLIQLLWGDHLRILDDGGDGERCRVRARGRTGYVRRDAIGDESLLEVYFIDVGQGDGVLVRTPDNRHIMIDGGYNRARQTAGKNAADFVDWKFARDYGLETIHLDAMIASHCDADHYGGLSDLLDVAQTAELDARTVTVDAFYHTGVSWWKDGGKRWLGETSADGEFLLRLLEDRASVMQALLEGSPRRLQGEWGELMGRVAETRAADGSHTAIRRLSHVAGYLPGFEPGAPGGVAVHVLAPVEYDVDGQSALASYGADPYVNTNGNSILLRLDHGHARILLTGDLNRHSQRTLLDEYEGEHARFACDVAKACHHGSDKVSYEFLSALRPSVTVISSGDTESHDHPRPSIVAASALTGHVEIVKDELVTPLVYSTELSRSLDVGKVVELSLNGEGDATVLQGEGLSDARIKAKVTKIGANNPTTKERSLKNAFVVTGLTYGLVNVRTDGKRILCATLNEGSSTWQVKVVKPRF
jgi:beta-lactamase superfamily II metal-dependent hydrolase